MNELIKTDKIEDESLRLSEEQLMSIKNSAAIREMLKNSALRQKIKEIDNSRMRLHLLQNSLLDEDFNKFAMEILNAVQNPKEE